MSQKSECRQAWETEFYAGMSHPSEWSAETIKGTELCFELFARGWAAAMERAQPAVEAVGYVPRWSLETLSAAREVGRFPHHCSASIFAGRTEGDNTVPVYAAPPAAANQAGTWQPIATAPKDGSMFLCWVSAFRYGEDDDGRRFEHDASTMDFCEWVKSGDDGHFMALAGPHGDSADGITHWMPLHSAPHAESHALGGGDD